MNNPNWPMKPGYYWARWTAPADGTFAEHETPEIGWSVVEVNANHVDWKDNPMEDEALSVSVPGVREAQWRDCFQWGKFVCERERDET